MGGGAGAGAGDARTVSSLILSSIITGVEGGMSLPHSGAEELAGFRGRGGRGRERAVMRCITSRALAGPQCEAMISNSGGFWSIPGRGDQGEVELHRLMVARAIVSILVSMLVVSAPDLVVIVVSDSPAEALGTGAWYGNPE